MERAKVVASCDVKVIQVFAADVCSAAKELSPKVRLGTLILEGEGQTNKGGQGLGVEEDAGQRSPLPQLMGDEDADGQ